MAIGRLDEKSEGLLLLTTDGKKSEEIRSRKVEKEYYVMLDGLITNEAIEHLSNGLEIRLGKTKYKTLPCTVRKLVTIPEIAQHSGRKRDERHGPTSWISITLREGKFRQIRKMTAAVDFPTLRLIRIRIGKITLEEMNPSQVTEISNLIY